MYRGSFDTHARWQPVTQSARSLRSYGKIEDCEQTNFGEALQFSDRTSCLPGREGQQRFSWMLNSPMLLVSCLVFFDWSFLTRRKNVNNSFQYRHLLSHMYTGWRNWRSQNKTLSTRPTTGQVSSSKTHAARAFFSFSQPPCHTKRPLRRRERKESK